MVRLLSITIHGFSILMRAPSLDFFRSFYLEVSVVATISFSFDSILIRVSKIRGSIVWS